MSDTCRMMIYQSRFGMNYVEQDVTVVAPGIGITDCWECGGDGDWSKFAPWNPPAGSFPCNNCKGTDKQYVDAWALPATQSDPNDPLPR